MTCPAGADDLWGPQVDFHCRTFDFTLFFEDSILGCVPPAIFLVLLPAALYNVWRQPVRIQETTWMALKLGTLAVLLVFQIAYIALRLQDPSLRTRATLPACILSVLVTIGAALLSGWQHRHSWSPSLLLGLYLPTVILLDIARVRTLWFIAQSPTVPSLFTVAISLTVLLLALEERKKRISLPGPDGLTRETKSGIWNRTFFFWLLPVFRKGFRDILTVGNLPAVDAELRADVLYQRLSETMVKYDLKRPRALIIATFHAFLPSFLSVVLPRLGLLALSFAQPFLVNETISYIEDKEAQNRKSIGKGLIGAYALVYTGITIFTALYMRQAFRFNLRVRGSLDALIYRQTARRKTQDIGSETTAMTLMGTDVERIVTGIRDVHEIWASIVSIAVATWLLERQLSGACVVPIILAAAGVLATVFVASRSNVGQRRWIEKVQKRLHVTAEMLQNMKAIKMLGLTDIFSHIVHALRKSEIETSHKFRKLIIWQIVLSNAPTTLAPVVSFAVFSIIAVVNKHETLETSRAFTSLTLISLLTLPVYTLLQTLPAFWQCLGCFDRIQEYCILPIQNVCAEAQKGSTELTDLHHRSDPNAAVTFVNATLGWPSLKEPVLDKINLTIARHRTTMVIGPVGSGKSTLLEAILKEATCFSGSIQVSSARVAYCAQTPWLVNDTVRNNIIGSSSFDFQRYAFVVWACALDEDIRQLPVGDATVVGSGAVTLSGGQKQRITLARSVYSRPELLLLDDVFSGLDLRTVEQISQRLLGKDGYLRQGSTTVVFATHAENLLPLADHVIKLEDRHAYQESARLAVHPVSVRDSAAIRSSLLSLTGPFMEDEICALLDNQIAMESSQPTPGQTPDENQQKNGSWSVYYYYSCAAGIWTSALFAAWILVSSFCGQFPTLWLSWWSAANDSNPNSKTGMYFGVYAGISIASIVTLVLACRALIISMISNSAMKLHADLLCATLGAPLQFFQKTDSGELTNRFSQDMELIDMMLPLVAINTADSVGSCLVKLVILCAVTKYAAITAPFFLIALCALQRFYLHTSRQVRLRDIEAKAPLYTHLLETVNGLATIRAFQWESTFEEKNDRLITQSQTPMYMLYCVQQWLQVVLDMMVAVLIIIIIAVFVSVPNMYSPGSVGVALTMVITFSTGLTSLIKNWTLMETSVGAVSRVQAFVKGTESESRPVDPLVVPPDWPCRGTIEFSHVVASYGNDSTLALKDISFQIPPGAKVAVCGRSGSGKTSLILCLLQMLDTQQGSISIDGIDLSRVDRLEVRKRINTVPQSPLFLPGTLRRNLDPRETVSDEEVIRALQVVSLWERITKMGAGLDMEMKPDDWSTGQRQLLCLARAVLRRNRILLLDEATSSVDSQTEAAMQRIIETEFQDSTVVAVVHHLEHIMSYDLVALMDTGKLIEYDKPAALLARESRFSKLYHSQSESAE